MMMKKILFSAVIALFAISAASAQEQTKWGVGPKIAVYTNTGFDGAIFGVGAVGRYSFADHWRVEPTIMALCRKGCSVEVAADIHYLFRLTDGWKIYPAVGLGVTDMGPYAFGMDLGVGTDFRLSRRWDLTAGVKWMPVFKKERKNPIAFSIGGVYKF